MRLSLDRLWLVIAIGLPVLVALLVPLPAVDLAYQVRAGDEILRTAALPGVDTWTFTVAGQPWTDQQWLAQVLLALGYGVGGWELLAVLRAGLVALALGCSIGASMARGAGPRMAAILGLLVFALAAPALALRPQLFGIAIFAALLWLVAMRTEHPRWLWAAPLLVVLWANIHGSFVLAPLVLGLRVARRRRPEAPAARVAVRPRRRPARDVRDAVRPRRLGLRGGDRRQPGDHRPGERVAADDAAHGAGGAVLRLGDRDAAGDVARPAGAALARLAVDRRDARDRRVDGPRPRVVAVRGGVRGRGARSRSSWPRSGPGAPSPRRDPRAWSARSSPSCSSSRSSPRCPGGGPRTR